MRCLITGATGFLGSHVAEARVEDGDEVFAVARSKADSVQGVTTHVADLCDRAALADVVAAIKPDLVFHFAAQSLPGVAWRDPEQTFAVNVLGTLHLLDALRASAPKCTIVVAGSSAEYAADGASNACIAEDHPLAPSSPYALSKIAAFHLCRLYARAYATDVRWLRPFFIIGPRKTGDATSDFARAVVCIERKKQDHIEVGNLEAIRDFLDVGDAVRAFTLIAERGSPGEAYNVCSGTGTRIADVLATIVSQSGVAVEVRSSPALLRPIDEPIRVGNPSRLEALGWRASIPLEQSLHRVLQYWRGRGTG